MKYWRRVHYVDALLPSGTCAGGAGQFTSLFITVISANAVAVRMLMWHLYAYMYLCAQIHTCVCNTIVVVRFLWRQVEATPSRPSIDSVVFVRRGRGSSPPPIFSWSSSSSLLRRAAVRSYSAPHASAYCIPGTSRRNRHVRLQRERLNPVISLSLSLSIYRYI